MENIRPIKTEADYDWAIAEITKYFENEPEVGSADGDRFDVLATLIEAYEDKHYPIRILSKPFVLTWNCSIFRAKPWPM